MQESLHLEVGAEGLATLTFDLDDRKVNIFTRTVLGEFEAMLDELAGRSDIRCLVLLSGKARNFIAGADVNEIAGVTDPVQAEAGARLGQRLFDRWSELPFPTVAAVRGTCVGGGTEWALACDGILISDREDIRIGLPEVKLGILPAWGGCSRLPRRVGIEAALDVILAGKVVPPSKAHRIGLADALLPDASFLRLVKAYATDLVTDGKPGDRSGGLKEALLEKNPVGRKILFSQARKQVLAKTKGQYPAPLRALEVVRVGIDEGLAAGLDAEARAIGELAVSPTSKNLVHVFGLMEGAKPMGTANGAAVESAAVLGAGVMGGGIAQLLAYKGDLPVRMKDIAPAPLEQGMAHASGLISKLVKRRRLTRPEARRKMALLRPSLDYKGFGRVDLVVEAVVERLDIKQQVFAELSGIVPETAILASNTSSLSIDAIAEDAVAPERVVGMHFFNPVHKMPLVEVVAGRRTSPKVVDAVVRLSHRLGKTPIVVQDAPGFLVNRLLMFSMAEAMALLEEGVSIDALDRIMTEWGMPMGPVTLTDEVGIDVAVHVAAVLQEAFSDRLALPGWLDRLVEEGRLGAKAGKGFYRYRDGERRGPDPRVYDLLGLRPTQKDPDRSHVSDRVVLPMLNEAARCLQEGVVAHAGDVDLAMIMGTGFPPFRGGLCRWADRQGVDKLLGAMERFEDSVGDRFRPSEAFRKVASAGGFYAAHPSPGGFGEGPPA